MILSIKTNLEPGSIETENDGNGIVFVKTDLIKNDSCAVSHLMIQ